MVDTDELRRVLEEILDELDAWRQIDAWREELHSLYERVFAKDFPTVEESNQMGELNALIEAKRAEINDE